MILIRMSYTVIFTPRPKINFDHYHPPRSFQSLRAVAPSCQNKRLKDAATADPPSREGLQMKEGWCAANSGCKPPNPAKLLKITDLSNSQ